MKWYIVKPENKNGNEIEKAIHMIDENAQIIRDDLGSIRQNTIIVLAAGWMEDRICRLEQFVYKEYKLPMISQEAVERISKWIREER